MPKANDLTGRRFGRLIVVEYNCNGYWKCKCDCGQDTVVRGDHLTNGRTKSCGCYRREFSKKKATTHGGTNTRLYHIWTTMRARCEKTYNIEYKRYGARGIKVCDEWQSFSTFREWALTNGYNDTLSIDRIDPSGDYKPNNCRWADAITQANNKRNNVIIEYDGEKYTMAELARISGLKLSTLWARLHSGWSVSKAVETPLMRQKSTPQEGY